MTLSRFVILGYPRTGSTFLHMLLASHPRTRVLGELFNNNDAVRTIAAGASRPSIAVGDDPVAYLEDHVYRGQPPEVLGVGFKLFYTHARSRKWSPLWDHLKSSETRVIHIKRRNFLDRHLSEVLAERTNVWLIPKGGKPSPPTAIQLDPEACLRDFHRYALLQNEADRYFDEDQVAELYYEDLAQDPEGHGVRLMDFLDLPQHELKTHTNKQQTRQRSEVIVNYADVREVVARAIASGSAPQQWLEFFDEPRQASVAGSESR